MGKRSQAKRRWPVKQREAHMFSDRIADSLGRTFRFLTRGLTRPDKDELRKRLNENTR